MHNVYLDTGFGALIMKKNGAISSAIQSGYTLIELMVVVALVGIISAIAYPTYQDYIATTYATNAVGDLKLCALAMDRYYSEGFTYAGATAGTGAGNTCNSKSPTQGKQEYVLSIESADATSYTIRATPISGACGGNCIELQEDGTQTQL